jgi:hypothetical protein
MTASRSFTSSAAHSRLSRLATALALAFAFQGVHAQGLIIYPAQGQSSQQQAQDENECRDWARQQTGFDPVQGPVVVQGGSQGGEVVRGAVGGAALGAIGGAIGGNTGKGAAIGAGVGATAGLMRKGQANRQQQQAQQQANADYDKRLNNYNRAFAACMQGRGYTVN